MSHTDFDKITFDLPKNQSNVIKVIGVGGGGSNAINHMYNQGIKGVDFVICNTDAQALENSTVPVKIQLGVSLTEGLGAGANPKIGEESAVESVEEIRDMLSTNTKMIFITAGMGGGTGTGAAPIIAQMARELNILTVGIVTMPFQFEGKLRNDQAQIGIENLRRNVDSLIVINNNKLREVYGNLGFKAGFSKADEVLATAARGIAEVITHHYTQNIDLRDAKTVLANSGTAIMGSATAVGSNRSMDAISKALDSPLLNDNKIKGAKNVLLLIVSGTEEITIDEIGEISDYIQDQAGHGANIIMGVGEDENLDGAIAITVIATGFDQEQQNDIAHTEAKRIIHTLEEDQRAAFDLNHGQKAPQKVFASEDAPVQNSTSEPAPETTANVVRHTLFEEESTEISFQNTFTVDDIAASQEAFEIDQPFVDYVATSDLIKNIPVVLESVDIHYLAEFKELDVHDIEVRDFEIVSVDNSDEVEDYVTDEAAEEQMLMFDLPIHRQTQGSPNQGQETSGIAPEKAAQAIEEIEVTAVELTPEVVGAPEPVKRFVLEEEPETVAAPVAVLEEEVMEIALKTETQEQPVEEMAILDPLNTPISKLLSARTEERKRKMKEFNYKFRNSASKIDEIEKQPAYKRMGIELEDTTQDSAAQISRTTINLDDDDTLDMRTNNSFLHDNVD